MDSIGSIAESEESDELLIFSEEPAGCGVSKTSSERSAECGRSKGAATVFEVQR